MQFPLFDVSTSNPNSAGKLRILDTCVCPAATMLEKVRAKALLGFYSHRATSSAHVSVHRAVLRPSAGSDITRFK